MPKNFHETRTTQKALWHGHIQSIGPFGSPKPKKSDASSFTGEFVWVDAPYTQFESQRKPRKRHKKKRGRR